MATRGVVSPVAVQGARESSGGRSCAPRGGQPPHDLVKAAIVRAYEMPIGRNLEITKNHQNKTYSEFAREKGGLFDRWCTACKASDFESLRELILLEEFKKCLLDRMVVYLNEQKVATLTSVAVLADEFTHSPVSADKPRHTPAPQSNSPNSLSSKKEERECFYCCKPGHVIGNCLALERKEQ